MDVSKLRFLVDNWSILRIIHDNDRGYHSLVGLIKWCLLSLYWLGIVISTFLYWWQCLVFFNLQALLKKVITREEWEKKLNSVTTRIKDMNKLVMNFLVTQGYVEVAERFQLETHPFHCSNCLDVYHPLFNNVAAILINCGKVELSDFVTTWNSLLENSRYRACNYHRSYGSTEW